VTAVAQQPPLGAVERAAGVKGRFLIRYTRAGRAYWDVSYEATAQRAESAFVRMAAEVGWKVTVDSVEARA
jgi:hypothetical protein